MTSLLPFAPTPAVAEFADILIDSAVLLVDGTQLTLTRGGITFDPGEEWDDYAFPGKTMATVGARGLIRAKPVLRSTAMLSGEDQISAYRPDGTWADHATMSGARTFTPNALRSYLTDYLENVVCLWKRQRGDYIAVQFDFAVCGSWNLNATDGDEGLFQLVIEAVQDNTPGTGTTKNKPPYVIKKLPTPPTPSDPPDPPPVATEFDAVYFSDLGVTASAGAVSNWANQVTGNPVDGVQTDPANKPTVDTGTLLNGYQSLKTVDSLQPDQLFFAGLLTGTTEATIFAVLKKNVAIGNGSLWTAGGNIGQTTIYPDSDTDIKDSALRTTRQVTVPTAVSLTTPHIYAVRGSASEWSNWQNGTKLFTTGTTTYQAGISGDVTLGINGVGDGFTGWFWMFGMVRRALTDPEMATMFAQIAARYGL